VRRAVEPAEATGFEEFYDLADEADALRYLAAHVDYMTARIDVEDHQEVRDRASRLFAYWRSLRAEQAHDDGAGP
jgi:hypothetical protein